MLKIQSAAATLLTRLYGIWSLLTLTAVTIPTVALLAVIPGEARRRGLVRGAAGLALRLAGTGLRVAGLDHLPERPCIVVANHASYLDGIILSAALPPRFTFVIKREMARVPFASFLLKRIGSEFVDRSDRHRAANDARRILQLASKQQSIVFFPEGTFTPEPGLRHFHNGAFAAALRGDLPVVPVIIRGSRRMLPARRLLPVPSRLEVTVKPPVEGGAARASVAELMHACRNSILEDLDESEREDPDGKLAAER